MNRVKIVRADRHARDKGFRAGQVYDVEGHGWWTSPKRGLLYLLYNYRTNRTEGFYADQIRAKPLHRSRHA